jgi:hypothetical protein
MFLGLSARARARVACLAAAGTGAAAGFVPCSTPVVRSEAADYESDAQAGGHADGVRFAGAVLVKKLQDEGRGEREAAALAALSRSPRWQRFVPGFGGVRSEGGELWLEMESLVAGMVTLPPQTAPPAHWLGAPA